MKKLLLLLLVLISFGCEQPTEYVEVEVEVEKEVEVERETVVTETITEYEDKVITEIEYVEVETEIEVEVIVEKEVIIEVEVEKEVIVETEIIIDNIIETTEIVYIDREVYIMSEEEIPAMEPIKEYGNYITTDSKVLGVVVDGFEEIPFIKGLFKIDGVIYFTVGEKNYSQENGRIVEIEPSDFPEVPRSDFFIFKSGNYKIEKSVYEAESISKVYNGTDNQGHYMIDGACLNGNDLIYSTPVDTGPRLKGVYIWTVNGNPQKINTLSNGRIW